MSPLEVEAPSGEPPTVVAAAATSRANWSTGLAPHSEDKATGLRGVEGWLGASATSRPAVATTAEGVEPPPPSFGRWGGCGGGGGGGGACTAARTAKDAVTPALPLRRSLGGGGGVGGGCGGAVEEVEVPPPAGGPCFSLAKASTSEGSGDAATSGGGGRRRGGRGGKRGNKEKSGNKAERATSGGGGARHPNTTGCPTGGRGRRSARAAHGGGSGSLPDASTGGARECRPSAAKRRCGGLNSKSFFRAPALPLGTAKPCNPLELALECAPTPDRESSSAARRAAPKMSEPESATECEISSAARRAASNMSDSTPDCENSSAALLAVPKMSESPPIPDCENSSAARRALPRRSEPDRADRADAPSFRRRPEKRSPRAPKAWLPAAAADCTPEREASSAAPLAAANKLSPETAERSS